MCAPSKFFSKIFKKKFKKFFHLFKFFLKILEKNLGCSHKDFFGSFGGLGLGGDHFLTTDPFFDCNKVHFYSPPTQKNFFDIIIFLQIFGYV